jgi:hypothetical protein
MELEIIRLNEISQNTNVCIYVEFRIKVIIATIIIIMICEHYKGNHLVGKPIGGEKGKGEGIWG